MVWSLAAKRTMLWVDPFLGMDILELIMAIETEYALE
jgi:hypothetical protein